MESAFFDTVHVRDESTLKRTRSGEDESSPQVEEKLVENVIFAAFCAVRQSGRYNMMTEKTDVFTAALCLLSVWRQYEARDTLLKSEANTLFTTYYTMSDKRRCKCEDIADVMPGGKDYVSTALKFDTTKFTPEIKAHIQFTTQNDVGESTALVYCAEKACLERGEWLRDTVGINRLRGVLNGELLKIAGAQIVDPMFK